MKNPKKQKNDIECIDCGHVFAAMPVIPIYRVCGGQISISKSYLASLPDNDNDNDND